LPESGIDITKTDGSKTRKGFNPSNGMFNQSGVGGGGGFNQSNVGYNQPNVGFNQSVNNFVHPNFNQSQGMNQMNTFNQPTMLSDYNTLGKHKNSTEVYIPVLRQQEYKPEGDYFSLADFVSPKEDFIGAFAVMIDGGDNLVKKWKKEHDTYNAMLVQTLADRLAEAATEWLHEQIRKEYWGYAKEEIITRVINEWRNYARRQMLVEFPDLMNSVAELKTAGIQ